MEELYTVQEVMHITKTSRSTIHRHMESGWLRGTKIGQNWKFTKQQVEDYIAGKHEDKGE